MTLPTISVIIPCRNEKNHIENCLDSVVRNDYPQNLVEAFVVDGQSSDGTIEKINAYQNKYSNLKLIENKNKTVPYALNLGIKNATGDFIIILGAHSQYPKNYFSKLIEWQQKTDADNIGGKWKTLPGDSTKIAKVIALAMSSIFGVGNALYRIDSKNIKETDTVPFGCYKKEIFEKIGLFDEELTRNQDDEFNGRLINSGGRIVLVPEIEINYYARKNLTQMSKMFYQYGLYKPLVNVKLGRPATLRQLAPPLFALGIFVTPFLYFIHKFILLSFTIFIGFYALLNFIFSLANSLKHKDLSLFLIMPVIFFFIHFSYGIGYLKGFIKFALLKQKVNHLETQINR